MLKETANAILEEPVKLVIRGMRKSRIFPWKMVPDTRELFIRPLSIGSLTRISRIILGIDPELLNLDASRLGATYEIASRHYRDLAMIAAIGFTNTKKEPPAELVDFLIENLTAQQLKEIFLVLIRQMDPSAFISSIVSIRGVNLLMKTNPSDKRSQIASGEPSAES